ncbi:2-dehydropantoate 2-reductase [Bacillus sp. MUM 116]|uniref:2-dehydropantoate 2-reductase n=1 Tax=Bacillus sp. MUM 116 TaxID=1678002 RepID=UPI0008F5CB15|nr:2-dehydropantoate 2-reductase [Bacillus sp. MUM 116]OIK14045.1 2-dehydropantoate 2-reductase [Bacillus sp. MUM 116]
MKIGIIGAGSLGLLFASYLSRVFNVTLYTRSEEQAHSIEKNGIILKKDNNETQAFVDAFPVTKWDGTEDLTFIAVKGYQLAEIIDRINSLSLTPKKLLFLQNGMAHIKQLESLKGPQVYIGSVEHGAYRENAYTVSHNGEGVTNVAVFRGDHFVLKELTALVPCEFPMVIKDDFYEMLVNKLIANAVINPLTAILGVKNGELIKNEFYFQTVVRLFDEISILLNLDKPEPHFKKIVEICNKTADNRSSMLKDIEANRKTEVEAILGFLLEKARSGSMNAPLVESLYFLIKGKELKIGDFR